MTARTRGGYTPCPITGGTGKGPCGSKSRLAKNVSSCRHCSANHAATSGVPTATKDFDAIFSSLEDTEPEDVTTPEDPGVSYVFPAHKVDVAISRIEAANRRLERSGIEDRFTYDIDYDTGRTVEGAPYKRATLTLNRPSISYNGWKFMARVDVLEGGTVLSTPEGVNSDDLPRPQAHTCDHCGTRRSRKRSYLLRNEEGEYKHIGHSCLDVFLGVSPSGLWALNKDIVGDLEEETFDDDSLKPEDRLYSVKDILAAAHQVTKGGEEHYSAAKAREAGRYSTADVVEEMLKNPNAKVPPLSDADMADIKEYAAKVTGGYGENLKAALGSEMVEHRQLALTASAVRAAYMVKKWDQEEKHNRSKSRTVEELAQSYPVGSKLGGFNATVVSSRTFEGYGYNGPTMLTALVLENEDGDQFTWMTGSAKAKLPSGTKVDVSRATVKGHKEYRGTASTHLKNVGVKPSDT